MLHCCPDRSLIIRSSQRPAVLPRGSFVQNPPHFCRAPAALKSVFTVVIRGAPRAIVRGFTRFMWDPRCTCKTVDNRNTRRGRSLRRGLTCTQKTTPMQNRLYLERQTVMRVRSDELASKRRTPHSGSADPAFDARSLLRSGPHKIRKKNAYPAAFQPCRHALRYRIPGGHRRRHESDARLAVFFVIRQVTISVTLAG
jgi:hypothetical protein